MPILRTISQVTLDPSPQISNVALTSFRDARPQAARVRLSTCTYPHIHVVKKSIRLTQDFALEDYSNQKEPTAPYLALLAVTQLNTLFNAMYVRILSVSQL